MHAFFDIHTHHPTGNPGVSEVENLRFGQIPSGKTQHYSAGLHPWFLETSGLESAKKWLDQLAAMPHVLAIGEAGLDKVCNMDWALQEAAFRHCIQVAETMGKPLIIHCVRAFNEVILIKKQLKPVQPWIFHGFNKHPDTARMLLKEGCFLSFGAALLKPGNHSAEALQLTPDDRFFLETDDAAEIDIVDIYKKAALLRGVSLEQLKEVVAGNVSREL